MARATTCDGTGATIPDDTPATGYWGHQYSDAARPVAEEYLRELNALHTRAARDFMDQLDALRARYHEKLTTLPDHIV